MSLNLKIDPCILGRNIHYKIKNQIEGSNQKQPFADILRHKHFLKISQNSVQESLFKKSSSP